MQNKKNLFFSFFTCPSNIQGIVEEKFYFLIAANNAHFRSHSSIARIYLLKKNSLSWKCKSNKRFAQVCKEICLNIKGKNI